MSRISSDVVKKKTPKIIKLYVKDKKGPKEISQIIGLKKGTVSKIIQRSGLRRSRKQAKIIRFGILKNENFFREIVTEEQAYWLGYLYADGCLWRMKIKGTNEFKPLGVSVLSKDKEHIEKFANIFGRSLRIVRQGKNKVYYLVQIYSIKILSHLQRLGFVFRKTWDNNSKIIESVPKKLLKHFIRGLFDGDGCISITKKKYIILHLMASMNFKLLAKIRYFLIKLLDITRTKIVKVGKKKNCYTYCKGGIWQCKKILDFMYKEATIFLERKRNIYLSYFGIKC